MERNYARNNSNRKFIVLIVLLYVGKPVVRLEREQAAAMAVLGRRCVDPDGRPDEEGRGEPSAERESGAQGRRRHNQGSVRGASRPREARGIEAQGREGEFFPPPLSQRLVRSPLAPLPGLSLTVIGARLATIQLTVELLQQVPCRCRELIVRTCNLLAV